MKQTKREKGSVMATIPHEIMVRSQPQRPMPLSDSSAETQRGERERSSVKVCQMQIWGERRFGVERRANVSLFSIPRGPIIGAGVLPSLESCFVVGPTSLEPPLAL